MKYTAGTVIDTKIAIMPNTKYRIQSISGYKRVFSYIIRFVKNESCEPKIILSDYKKTQPNTQVRAVAFFL